MYTFLIFYHPDSVYHTSPNFGIGSKEFHIEGEPLKEGGVLFRVPVDDRASMEGTLLRQLARRYTYEQSAALRGLNCRMEAVFYGEDGRELGRAELATPEDGEHAVN